MALQRNQPGVKLYFMKMNIYMLVCYKSPSAEQIEIDELLNVIKRASNNQVLITGDFNYPEINLEKLEARLTIL